MNLIDATVVRVCQPPNERVLNAKSGNVWWEVIVEYYDDDCGPERRGFTNLLFSHKHLADEVEAGYEFQH